MDMEYRMSRGNKVLIYFLSALFMGFGIFIIVAFLHLGAAAPVGIIFGAFLIGAGLSFISEAAKFCIVIDDLSLTVTHAFSTQSVLLEEIAGFRMGSRVILLELKSGAQAVVLPNNIERVEELRRWVNEKYEDIDSIHGAALMDEVIHDDRYGSTEEERAGRLAKARRLMLYSMTTPLLILWVIINPRPFELLMLILLAIPAVAVAVTWSYRGIIQVSLSRKLPYPTLLVGIIGAEFAASVAMYHVYKIYLFGGHGWLLLVACSVALLLIWAVACRAALSTGNRRYAEYLLMLVLAGVYSYNALIYFNCMYDREKPAIWQAIVHWKYTQHSNSTTYYLGLSPLGRSLAHKPVAVEYEFYHSVAKGDSVKLEIHPGTCGIAWYEVTKIINR
jgi:hypothetical protein